MPPSPKPYAVLRAFALSLPETHEDFPWGERVVKVRKKVFVFMGSEERPGFGMSVKLPRSGREALLTPFAKPTGYGLGKSGWVSVEFSDARRVPVDLLKGWIEESFRAVAPKTAARRRSGIVIGPSSFTARSMRSAPPGID